MLIVPLHSAQALQKNNEPHADHGIEVLYRYACLAHALTPDATTWQSGGLDRHGLPRRFTNFDPFERTRYFGRALDLGQFERFRRIFHTPFYAVLLNHQGYETVSSLQVRATFGSLHVALDAWDGPYQCAATSQREEGAPNSCWLVCRSASTGGDGVWW